MTRGTRLELADLPEEWAAYCRKRRPDLNPQDVWADFKAYWAPPDGTGKPMQNWLATWQGWVRREPRAKLFDNPAPPRPQNSFRELPAKNPGSAAYREFQKRMASFKARAPQVRHPRFVDFVQVGDALQQEMSEADREWAEERIAIQSEGK